MDYKKPGCGLARLTRHCQYRGAIPYNQVHTILANEVVVQGGCNRMDENEGRSTIEAGGKATPEIGMLWQLKDGNIGQAVDYAAEKYGVPAWIMCQPELQPEVEKLGLRFQPSKIIQPGYVLVFGEENYAHR